MVEQVILLIHHGQLPLQQVLEALTQAVEQVELDIQITAQLIQGERLRQVVEMVAMQME
jgi:hypothetical protein